MYTAAASWSCGRGPGHRRLSAAYLAGAKGNSPLLLNLHATTETLVCDLSTRPLCCYVSVFGTLGLVVPSSSISLLLRVRH